MQFTDTSASSDRLLGRSKMNNKNLTPIIKNETRFITGEDLMNGMRGSTKRNYNESRFYGAWRNDLNNMIQILAPSSYNSERYQDLRRKGRQGMTRATAALSVNMARARATLLSQEEKYSRAQAKITRPSARRIFTDGGD